MKAERAMSLGRNEIDSLTNTLQAQQELLQKLNHDLEVERESSAIAADEALSMILRLQGEKAAVGMEANQYKRIAEEKMCHVHEMLEVFQELIYQKEMQIASLEFQVQAYKFKLVSMGCQDLGASEMQYPENMMFRTARNSLRRGSSLPPPILDALSRRASSEGEKSAYSSPKPSPVLRESTLGGNFNSNWENIKKLDERVKELASENGISESCSLKPPQSTSPMHDPSKVQVQDIFEVPQSFEQQQLDLGEKIDLQKKQNKQMLFKQPTLGVADLELKQLNRRLKQLEDERFVMKVDGNNSETGDEELRLLREIRENVDSIQAQVMSWRAKNPPPREDHPVGCIREVMLCFWP